MGFFEWLNGEKKVKTVTNRKNWLGEKVHTVTYHDTGRKVKTVNGEGFFGGKVKTVYEKKGTKTCFKCQRVVSPADDGAYYCPCGKRFR